MKKLFTTLTAAAMLVGVMALPATATEGDDFVDFVSEQADKKRGNYNVIGQTVLALVGTGDLSGGDVDALANASLTAFLPTDRAFQRLVADLDPDIRFWWQVREADVIPALIGLIPGGTATIAEVVKYHIYAGEFGKVDYRTALSLDDNRRNGTDVSIEMYNGGSLDLDRRGWFLQLDDAGTAGFGTNNPYVVQRNIDAGNALVHGISEVLLP